MRQKYWTASKKVAHLASLVRSSNRHFAWQVARDQLNYLLDIAQPVEEQTSERAHAAVKWIFRAQDATPDAGVSFGYFPLDAGWLPSYPETTGYIIPTLLAYSRCFANEEARQRALRMAEWEVGVQMESGAVQGGPVCPRERQTPAAFNTGMVLDGLVAVHSATGESIFLEAARRAADFLMADLGEDGHFRTNGQFVAPDRIKTYNCLCAWGMYRLGQHLLDRRYKMAALRVAEAALAQQQPNGWFANNCLTRKEAPLLHTLGYTLQGILEVGLLAGRQDFVEAVKKTSDSILARMSPKGFLPGRFYSDWKPAVLSSCLTGSAQVAVVCYRLFEAGAGNRYHSAAQRIMNFLKGLQVVSSDDNNINGGISGSYPILGEYMSAGYPNWATKYFLDGLLLQIRLTKQPP